MVDILQMPQASDMLNVMRKFRHSFKYDGNQLVNEKTFKDSQHWAKRILEETADWFEKNQPNIFKA